MSSKYEYEESHGTDSAGFGSGLLVGAAIGALAAILFAPKSGKETRQQLKDLAGQQKDNAKIQWEQAKMKTAETAGAAREKLNEVAEQTKGAVDNYAEKAKGTVDQLAEGAKAGVDKLQKRY